MNSAHQGLSTPKRSIGIVKAGLKRRQTKEKRFRFYSKLAVMLSLFFLVLLFSTIISRGYSAFWQTYIHLDIRLDAQSLGVDADELEALDETALVQADFAAPIKASLRALFPEATSRGDKRLLYSLASPGAAFDLRQRFVAEPAMIDKRVTLWLPANDSVDIFYKGHIDRALPENERNIKDKQVAWIDKLEKQGRIKQRFNTVFFSAGDSRNPEQAGIWGAVVGSFFTLLVTLSLSFPIGVAAALYLEAFAPQNRWTDLIEVNINNLAAVPSIVFGLLGLAVFINLFGMPRSAPLVGGLVLALMTLPTIIIASRAAIKSVPPSIVEASLGLGASPMQTTFFHTMPLAMPGILTGTIIGMAQALGESAPLLMIGMVAFIVDIPGGVFDPATALPVQIYLWAGSPERAFVERTSAAIMILLGFLILMNALAVVLRKRFERRW